MKFSVGFQLYEPGEEPFSRLVEAYKDHIAEVFFPWQDIPSGRSAVATRHGYTDWTAQSRMEEELRAMKAMGIKLDLVFNGNCYGQYAISTRLQNQIASVLEHLEAAVGGVDIVTTASLTIAHVIKKHFPNIEVRASVNMKIGTVKAMNQVKDLFDSFHVQREYNRDIPHLEGLKKWADENGKKLVMLANSGCFAHCAGQIFHDNLVAHESDVCEVENLKDFTPYVCWRNLKSKENWHMVLQNTWVRPEDLHHYDDLFDTVKLATRMHSHPGMVIDAYCRRSFYGNTLDLFEPGFSPAFQPYIINNSAFPEDFWEKTSQCRKNCHECTYCKTVLKQVLFNTLGEQ